MHSSQCVQWVPFVFSRRFGVKSDRIVAQVWVLLATAFFSGAVSAAGNPVRVAFIDPLSGPFTPSTVIQSRMNDEDIPF